MDRMGYYKHDNSADEGGVFTGAKTHAKKGSYNIQHLKPWGPVLIRFLPSFTVMFLFLFFVRLALRSNWIKRTVQMNFFADNIGTPD